MTRTISRDARLIDQLARGRRTRYTWTTWVQIADDRAADDADSAVFADVIRSQTVAIPIGIAPCAGKIVRCSVNATQYVTFANASGGDATATFYKAVIGAANTALNTAITLSGEADGTPAIPTADTVLDGTLSTTATDLDLLEGQLVYCDIAVAAQDITAKSLGMCLMVEFVPMDAGYPAG